MKFSLFNLYACLLSEKKVFCLNLFTGIEVLSAVLVTCPWYQESQDERGEQARHNVLFIVYLSQDHQFLAPVNQHILNEKFVEDKVHVCKCKLYSYNFYNSNGCKHTFFCIHFSVIYMYILYTCRCVLICKAKKLDIFIFPASSADSVH